MWDAKIKLYKNHETQSYIYFQNDIYDTYHCMLKFVIRV